MKKVWGVFQLFAAIVAVLFSLEGLYTYSVFWVDLWHFNFAEAGIDFCLTAIYCSGTLLSLYVSLKFGELKNGDYRYQAEVIELHPKKSVRRKAA